MGEGLVVSVGNHRFDLRFAQSHVDADFGIVLAAFLRHLVQPDVCDFTCSCFVKCS